MMFSALYLALLLVLLALMARGVSFEYRGKRESGTHRRRTWSWAIDCGRCACWSRFCLELVSATC